MSKVAVYFCNGIGNLLMMTPAIQALSKLCDSKIDLVLPSEWNDARKKPVVEVLSQWDLIENIIDYPKDKFNPQSYQQLFITSHGEASQAQALFKKHGNKYDSPNWIAEYPHEIDYYMNEVWRLGYKGKAPAIWLPKARRPFLRNNRFKVAIYNGAASSTRFKWERKKWGKFGDLLKPLHNWYNCDILYLGGTSEQEEGVAFAIQFPFVKNFAGKLSYPESIYALKQCNLFISNDSSLMHAAGTLGVPLVALFGATLVSKNRPYSGKYKIVRGSGCQYSPCQYRPDFELCTKFKCMNSITTEQVMKVCRELV